MKQALPIRYICPVKVHYPECGSHSGFFILASAINAQCYPQYLMLKKILVLTEKNLSGLLLVINRKLLTFLNSKCTADVQPPNPLEKEC